MHRSIWIVLGILSALAGLSLLQQSPQVFATRAPEQKLDFILGTISLVGLCGVCSIACLFPRSHPVTLRIIGGIGIASCLFSIYSTFRDPEVVWLVILLRLALILIFWLPASIFLVYKGRMKGF